MQLVMASDGCVWNWVCVCVSARVCKWRVVGAVGVFVIVAAMLEDGKPAAVTRSLW